MCTKSAQSSPSPKDGNLAVAPDRQSLIRELVIGIMVCWKHASMSETTIEEIRRHAAGLKEQVIDLQPTDTELRTAKAQLKKIEFKIKLAPVRMLVAFLTEAAELQEDETRREVEEQFSSLIRPDVATWARHAIAEEYLLDEKVGNANQECDECVGADALCVCSRPPAGMTGGKKIARDPDTGRFIKKRS